MRVIKFQKIIPLVVFVMITGCVDDSIEFASDKSDFQESDWGSFSVVAPVETGINPYHEHIQRNQR